MNSAPAPAARLGGGPGLGSRIRHAAKRSFTRYRVTYVSYGVLLALILAYVALEPGVFTVDELNLQTNAALALILVATGQTIVLLVGGIDLSVGGVMSVATCFAATKFGGFGDQLLWTVLIVGFGAAAGLANGMLIAFVGLNAFVVTLASWSIFGGIALLILPSAGGTIPESYMSALTTKYAGISIAVILVVILAILWIWFRSTRTAARLKALGSDAEAAYLSGVSTKRTTLLAYALSGIFAALAGLFLVTQTSGGDPLIGNQYVLLSVAAAVIGGCSLAGGRGDVLGTIAGAFIVTLLGSVVFALELPAFWQPVATGLLLLIAAMLGAVLEQRTEAVKL